MIILSPLDQISLVEKTHVDFSTVDNLNASTVGYSASELSEVEVLGVGFMRCEIIVVRLDVFEGVEVGHVLLDYCDALGKAVCDFILSLNFAYSSEDFVWFN